MIYVCVYGVIVISVFIGKLIFVLVVVEMVVNEVGFMLFKFLICFVEFIKDDK